ncbi:hypothetical protein MKEN_00434300 [Mycena kentingensis (nom. inval.)]|nr:hypothetical protein MKEN_00434300 [Mycena kentingensis (nom. inval.)]
MASNCEFSKLDLVVDLQASSTAPLASKGALRPTTSNDTGRYERTGFSEPCSMRISPGMFARNMMPEPAYLPPQWTEHTHPEGQLYFARAGSPRVVTEAYLYDKRTLESVLCWVKQIEDRASAADFALSDSLELFVKLEEDDCAYYFVDHATRAQFWMDDVDTEELGLPDVVSISHLNLVCEELYWSHVEHFPMHIPGLPASTVDSLSCVFTHAICDQMTSRVSSFPYSKEECESFVKLLKTSRGHLSDGNVISTVARLWSIICRNRHLTFYGQEFSRLSRDHAVLYDATPQHEWVSTIASRVSFRTSERYRAKLDDVFVDHLVYGEQWKTLVTSCLQDWRGISREAFLVLLLHLFFLAMPVHQATAVASTALLGVSMLSSALLVHRFEPLQNLCASQAMDYLESVHSPILHFQLVALTFALPRALYLWGLVFVFANCLVLIGGFFGLYAAGAILLVAGILGLGFQWTTSQEFSYRLADIRERWTQKRDVDVCTSLV